MDDTELVGGALFEARNPMAAAAILAEALNGQWITRAEMRAVGLDPDLFEIIRRRLSDDPLRIERACLTGAAWARGLQAAQQVDPWELVATLPGHVSLPQGLRRTTGETLVQLITAAQVHVKAVAPYMTRGGLDHLGPGFAAATKRGVEIEIMIPSGASLTSTTLAEMLEIIKDEGDHRRLRIVSFHSNAPWAHLKVLAVDSIAAYVGSANFTASGIGGRNLEMGVLVRGAQVAAIEQVLETFKQPV
ncbi:phospholipase D-like domain-containing protein [Nonomuraea mangrovi]|uniref:Phospholipase D-like domain-containing protein n=1 Tax=Nonomuraea mangrovi TaxID=2316207 RepID=A0ABW4T105_9ACTN